MTEDRRKRDIDEFTGLITKVASIAYAKDAIAEAKKRGGQLFFCMLDLDKFKDVNDFYGHMLGDQVIVTASKVIREAVGDKGIAAHFGGDEFFIVIDAELREEEVRNLLRELRAGLAQEFANMRERLVVTCSIGVSKYPDNGEDFDTLFGKADQALYIAKMKGRNRYIIYREAIHGLVYTQELQMHTTIEEVLSTGKILRGTSNAIAELINRGKKAVPHIMEELRGLYGFDRIVLYEGESLEATYMCGNAGNYMENMAEARSEQALSLFDENDIFYINRNQLSKTEYEKALLEKLQKNRIREQLQYLIGGKTRVRAILSFENDETRDAISQTPSDEEKHLLALFVRVFVEVTLEDNGYKN